MSIWFRAYSLEEVNLRGKDTLFENLGMKIIAIEDSCIVGSIPVDQRTFAPFKRLHGGAMVAMAEELVGLGSNMTVDSSLEYCVGMEINANHVSSTNRDNVIGRASPIHLGKATQVWETKIYSGAKLLSVSRMTMMIMKLWHTPPPT
jgi:1,4-dihydroxy-2-naphthoyl-CoA hydrolase